METTILLVDDHPIVRQGLRLLLEGKGDMRIVGEAGDGQTAIERVRELEPDVVIMDITMPTLSGIEATRQILSESPDTKVIALSIHGEKHFIEEMLGAGAAGYILKDSIPEELVNAVRAVTRDEVVLSAAVAGVVVEGFRRALAGGPVSDEEEGAVGQIIPTKLHRPPITADLVPRPHLIARLATALQRPLTLLSASAGFGKTTLLAAWLESMERAPTVGDSKGGDDGIGRGGVTPPLRSAWLQLDAEDSDLGVFCSYFLAAVQTLFPNIGSETLPLLRAASRPLVPVLAASLLGELAQIEEPFVLVLDDYHRIQDEMVHDLVASLVEPMPPQMHLAIASQTDPPFPLNRLRARGQVLEIRSGDLRFTSEETHTFLEGMVSRDLDRRTTDLLGRKIEGWIAGLRLAALSMQGLPDVDAFVQRFEGTSSAYIAEYFLDEVLARQQPEIQGFLLQTSILDRFCASLCDAVIDVGPCARHLATTDDRRSTTNGPLEPDVRISSSSASGDLTRLPSSILRSPSSKSEAMIDELKRANVFLVPLDPEGIWYRFHHLFQDLLRERLGSLYGTVKQAALHARASAWFSEQDLVDEALDHALAAGDVAGAAQIVEQNRKVVLVDDQWYNLARWMERLPAEIKRERVELLLAQAWVLFHRLDYQSLPQVLEEAERVLARDGANESIQGEIDFFRGHFSYFGALGAQAEKCLASATARIPESYHRIWGEAELHYALAMHMNGQKEAAVDRLTSLIQSHCMREDISCTRLWSGLYYINWYDGSLPEVIRPARKIKEIASANNNRYAETWASYMEACAFFHWNDLESAVQGFNQLAVQRYIVHARAAIDGLCALSLTYQHLQRPDKADETVSLLLEFAQQMNDPAYRTIASSLQARLALLQGDIVPAVHWLRTADLAADAGIMFMWLEVPRLTACRVLIAEGSVAGLQQATEKLEQYDQENETVHNTCQRITILPLLALATHKQGHTDEALAILGRAVDLAEPGGFIRPFVDPGPEMAALLQELVARRVADGSLQPATGSYLTQIFAAFAEPVEDHAALSPAAGTAPGLVESLTEREMEILALLAQRLTNPEIARDLFITVGTVKQHTNSIFGKLGVGDRREAVIRARSLGLLPPA